MQRIPDNDDIESEIDAILAVEVVAVPIDLPPPPPEPRVVPPLIAMTIFSVTIVFVNKYLLSSYPYIFSLSAAQFCVGWLIIGCIAQPVSRPISAHLVGTCLAVVICVTNASLILNSIGTYQLFRIAKLIAVLPCSYRSLNHRHVFAAMLVSCGLAAAVAHDLSATAIGIVTAAAGALGSAWVGVLQKRVQDDMHVGYMSALLAFAPSQTFSALLIARIFDGPWQIAADMPPDVASGLLIASTICATCLNASHQAVLSRTSPLAYQLGTQIPSVIILCIGLRDETPSPLRITGIVAVLTAGAIYTLAGDTKRPSIIVYWVIFGFAATALLTVFCIFY